MSILSRVRAGLAAVVAAIDTRDVHVYSGLLLLSYGVGIIYLPAAFIAGGLGLVYLGLRRA